MLAMGCKMHGQQGSLKIIILSHWAEQQLRHSPVGDNVGHCASQTIIPCLSFTKEMPV